MPKYTRAKSKNAYKAPGTPSIDYIYQTHTKPIQSVIQRCRAIYRTDPHREYINTMDNNSVIDITTTPIISPEDIDILCSEYESTLSAPEMLYKAAGFCGLLEYIYKKRLKRIIVRVNNYKYDYSILNSVFFDVYLYLCGKYNMVPTIIQFCALCHIDNSNIMDVKNGVYRNGTGKVNLDSSRYAKNWYAVCESGLLTKAVNENGIGAIFGLKALYQYNDSAPMQVAITASTTHDSAEQIAARHAQAALPKKPDLDE